MYLCGTNYIQYTHLDTPHCANTGPTRSQDQIAHRLMTHLHTIFLEHIYQKQFHTGHTNGNINNDYFYTHIYIYLYTVINKYMSRSAPSPPDPLPKINHIPAHSEFGLHRKLIMMERKSETEPQIPQSWDRVTKAGESGRYHRCQRRFFNF